MQLTDILLVEDNALVARGIEHIISSKLKIAVRQASDGQSALESLRALPAELLLLDLGLPDIDGAEVLEIAIREGLAKNVIIISGTSDVTAAVSAIQKGAVDFITKPIEQQRLVDAITRVGKGRDPANETCLSQIVGESTAIERLKTATLRTAETDLGVLITGESGSGKELVAQALHKLSSRSNAPFVAMNCAVGSETMFASEMFGHERGAFTGAVATHKGRLERVDGGTLFLDEVCELPLSIQAVLLRVLQERTFERVGGTQMLTLNARVIAATNRDPLEEVRAGRFRKDLLYRLDLCRLHVPSLAERAGDKIVLFQHFIDEAREKAGQPPLQIESDAHAFIEQYAFAGSVRELSNIAQVTAAFCQRNTLDAATLKERFADRGIVEQRSTDSRAPGQPESQGASSGKLKDQLAQAERKMLVAAQNTHNGNQTKAAKSLGIDRSSLYRKLRDLGLTAKPK